MNGSAFKAVLAFCMTAVAWAQGSSTINGTVADPSGAVVPGAKITVVEVETHLSREAITNSEGFFVLSSLRPTRYRMTVEASGFRTFNQTGITLLADDSITISVKLDLGSTTDVVNVEASAVQVDTTTPTLRQVVDSARMIELPLNGRNAAQLTALVAGAVNAPSNNADQGST
jgi:carboxypeptidase family protein